MPCQKTYLLEHFEEVVDGFCDSLPIIKKLISSEVPNCKLESLAAHLKIDSNDAHNAIVDVYILEQIIGKLEISNAVIINNSIKWKKEVEKKKFNDELPNALKKLNVLSKCTSTATRKKRFHQISHMN